MHCHYESIGKYQGNSLEESFLEAFKCFTSVSTWGVEATKLQGYSWQLGLPGKQLPITFPAVKQQHEQAHASTQRPGETKESACKTREQQMVQACRFFKALSGPVYPI